MRCGSHTPPETHTFKTMTQRVQRPRPRHRPCHPLALRPLRPRHLHLPDAQGTGRGPVSDLDWDAWVDGSLDWRMDADHPPPLAGGSTPGPCMAAAFCLREKGRTSSTPPAWTAPMRRGCARRRRRPRWLGRGVAAGAGGECMRIKEKNAAWLTREDRGGKMYKSTCAYITTW